MCVCGWAVVVTEVEQSLVIYVMCVWTLSLSLSLAISLPPLFCCWQLWNICIDKLYAVSAHKPQNVDNNSKREGREWGENRQNSKYFDVTKPNWAWQGEHHMLLLNRMQQRLLSISSPFFHLVPPSLPRPRWLFCIPPSTFKYIGCQSVRK